jgi:hypothetical protein
MPARVVRPGGAVLEIPEPAASVLRAAAEAAIAGQTSPNRRQ